MKSTFTKLLLLSLISIASHTNSSSKLTTSTKLSFITAHKHIVGPFATSMTGSALLSLAPRLARRAVAGGFIGTIGCAIGTLSILWPIIEKDSTGVALIVGWLPATILASQQIAPITALAGALTTASKYNAEKEKRTKKVGETFSDIIEDLEKINPEDFKHLKGIRSLPELQKEFPDMNPEAVKILMDKINQKKD